MTHKQFKFGKGKRSRKVKSEAKPVEEEYESVGAFRRAVLQSSGLVDRLADESSRARLINQIVNSPVDHYDTREFASYYRAPTRYIEPPYSITSHTDAVYIPKALHVIPTYRSLIPAQWSHPYVRQAPEQYSQEELMMNRKYNCRCLECTSADCPANSQPRPRRVKDNIMTFSDQSTMTRNVNDTGCGCTPTPSTLNCPAMAIPRDTSMVRVRDLQGKVKFYAVNHKHGTCTPAPILKNGYNNADPVNTIRWRQSQDEYDEYEPLTPKSVKCYFREDETRKNLYNEGISDVAFECPSYPRGAMPRSRPPRSATPVSSRAMVLSDRYSDSEVNIPYSHRRESRYHKHCVDVPMQIFVQDNFRATSKSRIPVLNPTIPARSRTPPRPMTPPQPKTPCCSGTQNKPKQRTIKLPKKLLTSEKVVAPRKCKVPWGKRQKKQND